MKNTTNIKIPKKYQHGIEEIWYDSDGWWAFTNKGFQFEITESHTAHGDTQQELLSDIRSLTICECDECIGEVESE